MKHVVLKRYPLGNKRFIWKQKDFVLSTFSCYPKDDTADGIPSEVADRCVKNLKECGFNMLELGWVAHEGAWAAVDAAEKYGIDLIYQDFSIMGGMQHYYLENKVPYETVENLVSRLKDKKHVIGYYVWDEPHTEEQIAEARRQMDMLQKADPDALLFVVCESQCNGNPKKDTNYLWENGRYEPHVKNFIEKLDPPVLSFDSYPIGDNFHTWPGHEVFIPENQLNDTYMWVDMLLWRKHSVEKKLPFWFYYQGYHLFKCIDYYTFPMVRTFMYAAILHGAKGLQQYAAGETNNSLLKANGEKSYFYEDQKQIHSEIAALGDTLMALESKLVYHASDLLYDCEYIKPLVDSINDSEIFTGELPYRSSIGELEDEYSNRYAVVLNRDYEKPLSTTLDLKDDYRIYEVSKKDGKHNIIYDNTRKIDIDLAPGDAVVLRIQKATQEPFTIAYELSE